MKQLEYVMIYKFTPDEIKALRELEETLPSSPGQEVINDIITQSKLDGYSQYV